MIRFRTIAPLAVSLLLLLLCTARPALADRCSRISDAYSPCMLSTMCSRCVATSVRSSLYECGPKGYCSPLTSPLFRLQGCEYNLMSGTCASASNASSVTTYCSDSDSVCSSCTVSASKPTCTGDDGACICPSLCDIVTSSSSDCSGSSSSTASTTTTTGDSGQSFSMMYVAVAFGALCIMAMLYMQRRCAERRVEHHISLVRQEMEARREQRRREREMLRARRPELALNLETWRDHVELHKPQMSKVELETCYYLMMQDDKKKGGKKGSDHWDSGSEGGVKGGVGAVGSPIASGVSDVASLHSPFKRQLHTSP